MTYPAIVIPDHLEVALVPSSSGLARKVNQIVDLNGGHIQSHLQMRGAGGIAKVNDVGLMSIIGNTRSLILSGEATTFEDANKRENHARADTALIRALGAQIINAGPILETISAHYLMNSDAPLHEISVQKMGEILKAVKLILDLSQTSPLPQAEMVHIERLNNAIQSLLDVITQQPMVMQIQFLPLIQSIVETIKPIITTHDLDNAFLSEFDHIIDVITVQKMEIEQLAIHNFNAGDIPKVVIGNESITSLDPLTLVQTPFASEHDINQIPIDDSKGIKFSIESVEDIKPSIIRNDELYIHENNGITNVGNGHILIAEVMNQAHAHLSNDIPPVTSIVSIDTAQINPSSAETISMPSGNHLSAPIIPNVATTKGVTTNNGSTNFIEPSVRIDNYSAPITTQTASRIPASSTIFTTPQSKSLENIIPIATKPISSQIRHEYKPVFNQRHDVRQWTHIPANTTIQIPKKHIQPTAQQGAAILPRAISLPVIRDRLQQIPLIRQERQNFSKSIEVIRHAVQAPTQNVIKIDSGVNNNIPLQIRTRNVPPQEQPAKLMPRLNEAFKPIATPMIERIKQKAADFHDTIRNNKAVQAACALHGGICRCADKFREVSGFAVSTKNPEVKVSLEALKQDQKDQKLLNDTIDKIRDHEKDKKIMEQHENDLIRAVRNLPRTTEYPADIKTISIPTTNLPPSNDGNVPKPSSSLKALRAAQNKTPNLV